VAGKMIEALGVESRFGDHLVRLTASIGISIYPDDGVDADVLIERADAAMYRAKRRKHGSFAFHGEQLMDDASAGAAPPEVQRQAVARRDPASAGHERRNTQLQEANTQLVLTALGAQDLQAAAERALRQQTEFLAVLAHELRNPLAPIRTAAALLGRVRNDEALVSEVQAVIERQVAHMSRLVSDLLDVSRVSTGKLRLERRCVDIAGIIDAAIDACQPTIAARRQRFEVRLPSGELELYGDPIRLAQVVSNLLDNASKYTPEGGEIGLSAVVIAEAVVITVSDSGIGITPEAMPKIFEPFVQEAHAIGFNGVGLGIGLTVVRELVEAHGGQVVASSAGTGLGSEFVVILPLTRVGQSG
jgi:signal transduction histidine kinase